MVQQTCDFSTLQPPLPASGMSFFTLTHCYSLCVLVSGILKYIRYTLIALNWERLPSVPWILSSYCRKKKSLPLFLALYINSFPLLACVLAGPNYFMQFSMWTHHILIRIFFYCLLLWYIFVNSSICSKSITIFETYLK